MVKTLGRALKTWHLVEWFHQNIGSDHTVSFRQKDMYDIDYRKPYILVALSSLAPLLFIQYLEVTIAWGSLYVVLQIVRVLQIVPIANEMTYTHLAFSG